ncbi:putative clostridium epsilon toxin ETX/ mosquitocidal toxin MTX2, Agglutinin [Rosa chinensis]|uniref:Putative clostridium epsilon toxin ETX/ mosquitocidal toxin MTX2, Agglutinin n=1 Tax=Rosa chinensis TaxID=74649 RepID=A0A2P6Q4Y1_ROSCH|nr:putative clostridium epsilon toxin ETX/ mosquitocidal toxin MTX2, Agglutinin [Rosa chinensis]PRQ29244.1 putative clostridium epsilon toxin ETX/ mosquitocidal toxin MTX2, Agglutinin [Rosa chinensis]PRQ29245.1 putative clostridium epsilon toxin ETX/ mosquitocidal toxin MTX2, Agglutinin [Rosa chinensis]
MGLVHIRCSQNRKFLRTRIEGDVYLSPEADEPEEDQSKWSCTLFEPQAAVDGNPDKARLFHVQAKRYATVLDDGGVRFFKLDDGQSDQGIFDITDWQSLVILPKHVAFKANNNLYLQLGESNQLRFVSTDKGIPASWFEVSTDGDGMVKIKCYKNNSYLRFGGSDYSNWIFADGGSASKPPTLFLPIKVDTSAAALKCLGNDKFCALHTYEYDYTDGLNAPDTSTSISNLSRWGLEELVLSRRIYNADFDLKNAIIYGETPVTMATANASNNTSAENTVEFKFAYKDGKSSTWKASHSWMIGMSVSASFKIPFIGGTDVTAQAEYSGSYEWGETITSENTLETTYKATVPANTSITVSLMATKGSCDVPYSMMGCTRVSIHTISATRLQHGKSRYL